VRDKRFEKKLLRGTSGEEVIGACGELNNDELCT
jgi:hypothetical protein